MPRQDVQSFSGEQFAISGQVTKPGVGGWPTGSTAGYNLLFTAKRRKTDALASAIVAKSLAARAGYTAADVTLATGGAYTVTLHSADTQAFTKTELLYYDIILIEPDGTETVVDYGTWKVSLGAGS